MSAIMSHIRSATFRRVRTVVANQSPFSGKVYRAGYQDWRWQFQFEYGAMKRPAAQALLAEIAAQGEGVGSFLAYDPDAKTPLSGYGGALGVVAGAGQAGQSIATSGWTAGATVGVAGDYVFLSNGTIYMAFTLTANTVANGTGAATLALDAPVRSAPANGSTVQLIAGGAVGITSRLVSYDKKTDPNGVYTVTLQGEEIV